MVLGQVLALHSNPGWGETGVPVRYVPAPSNKRQERTSIVWYGQGPLPGMRTDRAPPRSFPALCCSQGTGEELSLPRKTPKDGTACEQAPEDGGERPNQSSACGRL